MESVIVIGGGAAGFFAAIACARENPNLKVILLEAAAKTLGKVKVSGGGRCNVTHSCFEPGILVGHYPRGGKALRGAFSRFQPRDTIAWFEQEGVKLKTESDGRLFPISDDSATIVQCLEQAAQQAGVEIRKSSAVVGVEKTTEETKAQFQVKLKTGESLSSDRLLLATGSSPQGYAIAKHLGHRIVPPVPSLFTFNLSEPKLNLLAGVSVAEGQVKLANLKEKEFCQAGAILVTHWGLSGPAVLKLSAWGARVLQESGYRHSLQINWLPNYKPEAIRQHLIDAKKEASKKAIANFRPFPQISLRLWQFLLDRANLDPSSNWADLSQKKLEALAVELGRGEYAIAGKGSFKDEFVTCGGVALDQVNFKTLESRICEGLYFAGEVLDIDGVTGGFNFQSAWTTGYLAGVAIAQSFLPHS
jgi:predicted Rossmann fold flavoprotein